MFGSRKTTGAIIIPRPRRAPRRVPSRARASSRRECRRAATNRVDGSRAQRQPELREAEEQRQQNDDGPMDTPNDSDVLNADRDAARRRSSAWRTGRGTAGSRRPRSTLIEAVEERRETETSAITMVSDGRILDRSDHDALDRHTAHEGDREHDGKRRSRTTSPWFISDQAMNVVNVAISPCAKLMTPRRCDR